MFRYCFQRHFRRIICHLRKTLGTNLFDDSTMNEADFCLFIGLTTIKANMHFVNGTDAMISHFSNCFVPFVRRTDLRRYIEIGFCRVFNKSIHTVNVVKANEIRFAIAIL